MDIDQKKKIRSYELVELIGKGGFGEVYRAYQPTVGREVAIKVIMRRHANEPDFIRNFESEAKMVARLEHPYVVPLFDYWREPTGAYIVMRYLRGGSLKDEMSQSSIPLLRVADILDNICSALWSAHRNRVAHRDIKPANIMMDNERRAYLSDFGLAIEVGEDRFDNLVGTWLYMPPERIQNKKQSHTIDVYSLGIMTFQMITGEFPFERGSMQKLAQSHISQVLPPIQQYQPEIPPELNMILQRATSKDPEARFEDIRVFAQDFRQVIQPLGTMADVTQVFASVDDVVNPYMGLRPFQEADSRHFFGRVALVEQLLSHLNDSHETNNFLALVGPSGSGKSSVIYAGLIPQLKLGAIQGSDTWYYASTIPGSQPFQNLMLALRSIASVVVDDFTEQLLDDADALNHLLPTLMGNTDARLFLFIDQFEELFTQVDDENIRQQFLDLLTQTVHNPDSHVRIIITLRADFYDRPLRYEEFGKLIQQRTEVILPLDTTDLEQVIARPAKQVGLDVEPELIAEIITDVKSEPGALPLLQYTLTELFNRRDDAILTLKAYRESGGVRGALARRADEVYQSLPDDQQLIARQLFLRLVTLGEGTEDTRRRTRFSALQGIAEDMSLVSEVMNAFSHHRLLTFDRDPETREPTVEVAHEALIREWQQFQIWLNASRADLRLQRLIDSEVADWREHGKDTSYLLRGNRLSQFEHWAEASNVVISAEEQQFIQASIQEQLRENEEQAERQRKELALIHQSRSRLRYIVVLLLVAAIGGFILIGAIIRQNQEIQQERDSAVEAEANALLAEENALNAQSTAEFNLLRAYSSAFATTAQQALGIGDHSLALAFALEAWELDDSSDIAFDTLSQIAYGAGISRIIQDGDEPVSSLVVSMSGNTVMTVAGPNYMNIFEQSLLSEERHQALVLLFSATPNFTDFNFANVPSTIIRVWNTRTGQLIGEFTQHNSIITGFGFVPTEDENSEPKLAYSATILGEVLIWDIVSGEIIQEFSLLPHGYNRLSISADGRLLLGSNGSADTSTENRLVLWDVQSGKVIRQVAPHTDGLWDSVINAEGTQAVSIYLDRSHIVWDTETGDILTQFELDDDILPQRYEIALNSANDKAVTNVGTGEVYIWEIEENGELDLDELAFSLREVFDITLSDNGHRLLLLQPDGEFIDWDVLAEDLNEVLEERGVALNSIDLNADGNTAVMGRADGSILVWDLTNLPPYVAQTFSQFDSNMRSTFLPTTNESPSQQLLVFDGEFNADQTLDSSLSIWDVDTGREVTEWDTPHTLAPADVLIDATGQHALTWTRIHPSMPRGTNSRGSLILWDLNQQSIIQEIRPQHPIHEVKFVPNSDPLMIISTWQNGVALWNMETGDIDKVYEINSNTIQVDITYNKQYIFASSRDGQMYQWDYESGEVIGLYTLGASSEILEVSSQEPWVITGYNGKEIVIWDYETQEEIVLLEGHTSKVLSANTTITTDQVGDYLTMVSSDMDGNVIYWNLEDFTSQGSLLYDSRIHTQISPNGIYHTVVPAIGILDVIYVQPPDEDIFAFIDGNRILHEITLQDCVLYNIEEICLSTIFAER